ncbi:unnamed protein product [Phytophthora lilii]|uniref:Unnamed protein product n=1 Tax=Phytophthora lilii TaxID=2077276 RepID=A0A9W6TDN2_9STRA|nr:unnamed protein product [Phytophthora lilii]
MAARALKFQRCNAISHKTNSSRGGCPAVMVACGGCLLEVENFRAVGSWLSMQGSPLLAHSQIRLEDATATQETPGRRQDDPDADRGGLGVSVDVSLPAYRRSEPGCPPLPARPIIMRSHHDWDPECSTLHMGLASKLQLANHGIPGRAISG